MLIEEYLKLLDPLSLRAKIAVGIRIFERYVRLRGLEDSSIWTYLNDMWEFPNLAHQQERMDWQERRGDLADFGLGDELPEELEEELASLAINEDYFEYWVISVTELAWSNLLDGVDHEETMVLLKRILQLAAQSEVGAPELGVFQSKRPSDPDSWGERVSAESLGQWQAQPCTIVLEPAGEIDCSEAVAFFD